MYQVVPDDVFGGKFLVVDCVHHSHSPHLHNRRCCLLVGTNLMTLQLRLLVKVTK